jgi:lysophospholipase L1-like esterase
MGVMRRIVPILLVLFGLAMGLVLAELAARWVPRPSHKGHMVSDPLLHHRLKRNWTGHVLGEEFRTNSLGLRDREYRLQKPEGTFRIFMLGDSFTEGGGLRLSQTVAKQVERMLNGRPCGKRFEVINGGTPSYSPITEYLQLKLIGLQLHPDLVVLNFDMTDVHDDLARTVTARLDANGLPLAEGSDRLADAAFLTPPLRKPRILRFLDPLEVFLNRHSRLYHDVRESTIGQWLFGSLKLTPERLEALHLIGNIQYDITSITRDGDFPGMQEAWTLTKRYIVGIRDLARERGLAFVFVVYPHAQQVSAAESPAGRRKFGIGPGFYASERPFQILEELGRQEGFPVINLLSLFRQREVTEAPLYWYDDPHFNAQGARVLAEGIFAGLLKHRLVPCRP